MNYILKKRLTYFKFSASIEKWSSEGRRCIWFKINIKDSAYVPILADVSKKHGYNLIQFLDYSLFTKLICNIFNKGLVSIEWI